MSVGRMGSVKIMAKDLVRTRTYITKFIELRRDQPAFRFLKKDRKRSSRAHARLSSRLPLRKSLAAERRVRRARVREGLI